MELEKKLIINTPTAIRQEGLGQGPRVLVTTYRLAQRTAEEIEETLNRYKRAY